MFWSRGSEFQRALDFADRALILNTENAKSYAIRGMIRVASGLDEEAAWADLVNAFNKNKAALGDEPETLQATVFVVKKLLAEGNPARAKLYFDALGDLKPFGSEQALRQMEAYQALAERF